SQEACLTWQNNAPNPGFLHLYLPIRILSPVDPFAMQRSLQTLADRHPALRARFFSEGGQGMQRIADTCSVVLEQVRVESPSWQAASEPILQAAMRPFDLQQDLLLRGHLFSRGFRDHILLIVTHHIAVDATAFAILLNELFPLYAARLAGEEIPLPEVTWTFGDFVLWQSAMLKGPVGARLWDHWRIELKDDPPLVRLPNDFPGNPVTRHEGACHAFHLEPVLVGRLRALARKEEATLYMVLLAAFQQLLHLHSGQEEILVATHTQNRDRPEWEGLVGYLSDTVAIRTRMAADERFSALLQRVRHTLTSALMFQGYPMKRLERQLQLSREALCNVWFTMLPRQLYGAVGALLGWKAGDPPVELGGLRLEAAHDLIPAWLGVWYDLELNLMEAGDEVSGTLCYRTDLFGASRIAHLARDYQTLLQSIAEDPSKSTFKQFQSRSGAAPENVIFS
ncbi:MAG: hypothetical protein HQL86_05430, partial [Magnetococcales bacterium]|nr:hypothetical protein [Magnetococcales bacterium]